MENLLNPNTVGDLSYEETMEFTQEIYDQAAKELEEEEKAMQDAQKLMDNE